MGDAFDKYAADLKRKLEAEGVGDPSAADCLDVVRGYMHDARCTAQAHFGEGARPAPEAWRAHILATLLERARTRFTGGA